MEQNRLKSPVFWAALAAQLLSIAVLLGWINLSQSDTINAIVAALLQEFIAFGLLNNPQNPEGF